MIGQWRQEDPQNHPGTNGGPSLKPLPEVIEAINRRTQGWVNYFSVGYPAKAYREVNHYLGCRLI
ncbi:MAG: group II intron maturase-specific domain-containing protein, partial [Acidobacteriota bacterium]